MKRHNILTLLSLALISTGVYAQNLTPIQSQILGKPTFSISNNRTTGETQVQVMPTPSVVLSTTTGSKAPIQNAPGNVTPVPSNLDEEGPEPSQAQLRGMNPGARSATPAPIPSTKNLNPMTSPTSPVNPINPVAPKERMQPQSKPVGQQKPNTSHVYGDISSWNKTTIEEHERLGKKMGEEEYKKFLMK